MISKINKKSQAALEFIMTYGWAILVVLVAVGALAYFGVLSPDKFLPSKCTLQAGIGCMDHKASSTTNQLQVRVQNSLGYAVNVDKVSAAGCTCQSNPVVAPCVAYAGGGASTLDNGGSSTYTLTCPTPTLSTSKYNGNFNITYTNQETSIQHVNQGQITTKVE